MKYDIIIIGGGLSGLTAGLRLQKAGRKTAIISAGQNALHFASGSFSVLGDGVTLPEEHPYRRLPMERYLDEVKPFFAEAGILLGGDPHVNGWRLTPSGSFLQGRFSLEETRLFSTPGELSSRKALIVNIPGFLDFNTAFLADGLAQRGIETRIGNLDVEDLTRLRTSPSEMRSVNIARTKSSEASRRCSATKTSSSSRRCSASTTGPFRRKSPPRFPPGYFLSAPCRRPSPASGRR